MTWGSPLIAYSICMPEPESRTLPRTVDAFDFYYVFGLFRLAVIAQQIYYRYYHGQTTNKRFAMFGQIVPLLIGRAEEIIKESDL